MPPSTPPTRPPLDSALAKACPALPKPEAADYDAWQDYTATVIGLYADCAARHRKTVQAWPK
jgi:hypothetical protein